MIFEHCEEIEPGFEGTIIDIETIGEFARNFSDSRQFAKIRPFIFGYIGGKGLRIVYAEKPQGLELLGQKILPLLNGLQRPFYAFNASFEMGVLFHSLKVETLFDAELNKEKFEPKRNAVQRLCIPQYDDPFNDNGLLCIKAWEKGEIGKAVAHNRSCLLKERDILLKRGCREPDKLDFVKG
jgi:hypothetical protein